MNYNHKNQHAKIKPTSFPPSHQPKCKPGSSTAVTDRFGTLYIVSFLGVVPVSEGYRWDYLITNIGAREALSNWILGTNGCFSSYQCYVGDVVDINSPLPDPPTLEWSCEYPGQNEQYCPYTDPCQSVVGLKFAGLDTSGETALMPGTKQRFSFFIPEDLPAELSCFQLKFGYQIRSGKICAPTCPCENPCECEEDNSFECKVMFPDCFTFNGNAEDIRVGYCIGNIGPCERDGTCEALTQIDVCDSRLQCCVEIQRWSQDIDFTAIFNVPLMPLADANACVDGIFACCVAEETAVNTCFTCIDDQSPAPPCVDPDCENTAIEITEVKPICDRYGTVSGIKIEYTFVTPACDNEAPGM